MVLLLALAACAGPTGTPPVPAPVGCTVAGLEDARPVKPVDVPGCQWTGGGPPTAPTVLTGSEQVRAALSCADGVPEMAMSGVDIYVVSESLSPAWAGGEVLDDGTTVTFVTRFRSPCPDDPLPMPITRTYAFWLTAGAVRTFREASCTLPAACN